MDLIFNCAEISIVNMSNFHRRHTTSSHLFNPMTKYFIFVVAIFLSGCGEKPEYTRAKELMSQFKCATSNGTWAKFMNENQENAQKILASYENGRYAFTPPVDEVIRGELEQFKSACNSSNNNETSPFDLMPKTPPAK
jgi:hypothetical protein